MNLNLNCFLLVLLCYYCGSVIADGAAKTNKKEINFEFNDYDYTFVLGKETMKNNEESYEDCINRGMTLATVSTKEELSFLGSSFLRKQIAKISPGLVLDGIIRISAERPPNGKNWLWGDDSPVKMDWFLPNEGNHFPRETECGYLSLKAGQPIALSSGKCKIKSVYLCKSKVKKVPTTTTTIVKPHPTTHGTFSCSNKAIGRYEDPQDCASFFICNGGADGIRTTCQHRLYFDPNLQMCDHSQYVQCGGRPSKSSFSCKGKPCGYYQDERNCAAYFFCEENSLVGLHRICPGNLVFNKDMGTCDSLKNTQCPGRSQPLID